MSPENCLLCSSSTSNDSQLTTNQLLSLCKILKISNPDALFQEESFTLNSSHICSSCSQMLANAQQIIYQLQELESKLAQIGAILQNNLQATYLSTKNRLQNDSECSNQLQTLLCQAARVKEHEDYIEIVPLLATGLDQDIDAAPEQPEASITQDIHSDLQSDSDYEPNNNENSAHSDSDESDAAVKSEDLSPPKPKRRRWKPASFPCVYSTCDETFDTYRHVRKHLFQPHNINADTIFLCSLCDHSELTYSDLSHHIQSDHEPEITNESAQLSCQFCGEHFKTVATLRIHLSSHQVNESALCNTCGKTFENERSLKVHMMHHAAESGEFTCEKCERKFTSKIRLDNHGGHCSQRKPTGPCCRSCKKIFNDQSELEGHRNESEVCRLMYQKAMQKCPQCRQHLPKVTSLEDHLKECQGWLRGKCPYLGCRKKYLDDEALKGHLYELHDLTVQDAASFKCSSCEENCSTYEALKTHMETSHDVTSSSPLWCQICGSNHPDVRTLRAHIKQEQKLPFQCAVCSKTFSSSSTLATHKKLHKDQAPKQPSSSPHSCLGCKESFASVAGLRVHLRTCNIPIQTVYCEECGKDFEKQHIYLSHMISHAMPSISCDVCDKEFKIRSELQRHRRTHFPELKIRCDICSKGFHAASALKRHIKGKHFMDTEGFKCDHCEYKCVDKSMMERHNRRHTGERNFVCDVCGVALTNPHGLKLHMKLHGDRPYKCEFCGFAFISNFKYARHVKTHILPKKPHYKILRKLAAEAAEREKEQEDRDEVEQMPVLGVDLEREGFE